MGAVLHALNIGPMWTKTPRPSCVTSAAPPATPKAWSTPPLQLSTHPDACTANALDISSSDVVLLVVPMFHTNARGMPYTPH
jgi:hypothetical protein